MASLVVRAICALQSGGAEVTWQGQVIAEVAVRAADLAGRSNPTLFATEAGAQPTLLMRAAHLHTVRAVGFACVYCRGWKVKVSGTSISITMPQINVPRYLSVECTP